ncbi:unnamed protein product [Rotaria magnacalcarata]|uniref:NAD(P)(+)--arginine ADP-ribosyltransferase n=4 Tax=Rotaria magnacalcarata TaxID=392030 RepID=A0A815TFD6_9BILA|nr:unnamed protein product [Rotaria magnacalcarata]
MSSRFYDIEPVNKQPAIGEYLICKLVSLEEAVVPVSHIVMDIIKYAASAKLACKAPSENLTCDESAAIYLYTMETECYSKMNKALRLNLMEGVKPWFLYLKLLHTALNKLPCQKLLVWRGITGDVSLNYSKNTKFTWAGVSSASTDISVLHCFLPNNTHCTLFSINSRYGKSVVKHSAMPNECEIILMPGTRLRVKGILHKPSLTIIQLEEENNPKFKSNLAVLPGIKSVTHTEPSSSIKDKMPPDSLKKNAILPAIKMESEKQTAIDNSEADKTLTCPHCQKKSTYIRYKQGGTCTCSCGSSYKQVTCPHCHKPNYWKNPNDYVVSNRIHCTNCSKAFQQLTCPHCSQCNYSMNANYIEGNVIDCCTCKKSFQVMICTLCSSSNIWKNADHIEGHKVTCSNCKKLFQKVSCTHCNKLNNFPTLGYHEGLCLTCAYCSKKFQRITCPHCGKEGFWENADYLQGTRTSCWSCKNIFQCVNCFHCNTANKWLESKYEQGSVIACRSCSKSFQQMNCPHCKATNWWKNANQTQGEVIKCHSCKEKFQHIACPNCSAANIWKEANYHHGQRRLCFHCTKPFQMMKCPHCQTIKFFTTGSYRQGNPTTCITCKKAYQLLNCPYCKSALYFSSPGGYHANVLVDCCSCNKSFYHLNCSKCGDAEYFTAPYQYGTLNKCSSCDVTSQYIKCIHCDNIDFWHCITQKCSMKYDDSLIASICYRGRRMRIWYRGLRPGIEQLNDGCYQSAFCCKSALDFDRRVPTLLPI